MFKIFSIDIDAYNLHVHGIIFILKHTVRVGKWCSTIIIIDFNNTA